MTLREMLSRETYRDDEAVSGHKREHQDVTSDEIRRMRAERQRRREMEQHAGPDDGREMFKLAEEFARAQAPVDTDLNPGNPEAVGLMAESQGSMAIDQLASGQNADGDMADLMVEGDTEGGLLSFISGDIGGDDGDDSGGML